MILKDLFLPHGIKACFHANTMQIYCIIIWNPKYRLCDQYVETIGALISRCSLLTPNECKNKGDSIPALKDGSSLPDKTAANLQEPYPESLVEGTNVTILCFFSINTHRTIQENRLDIIIINDRKKQVCTLINMNVPSGKKHICKGFCKTKQIQKPREGNRNKRWLSEAKNVPVEVRALSRIKKNLEQINKIPGTQTPQEMQKIILTNTAHILQRGFSIVVLCLTTKYNILPLLYIIDYDPSCKKCRPQRIF